MKVLKDPFSYCNVESLNTTNRFQRALVFQGGGSLGAYEAGVYKATYELLSERDVAEHDLPSLWPGRRSTIVLEGCELAAIYRYCN